MKTPLSSSVMAAAWRLSLSAEALARLMACVSEIKSRGWRIVREDGDYSHFCSGKECRASVAKKQSARAAELLDRPFRSVK